MKLYYDVNRYAVDGTLAITTWIMNEYIGYEPYGDVTVNLSAYDMKPISDRYIFIPTYKMTPDYYAQILEDIVEEVVLEVPIGYGKGVYAKLKENWAQQVEMVMD